MNTFFHKLADKSAAFTLSAVISLAAWAGVVNQAQAANQVTLLETGSSLLYPLFNIWVPDYTRMNPDVRITTQSTGSGTGIAQAVSSVAQIGASDAYMSNAQMKQHPEIMNIPLAISAQTVNYNVPGLNKVHLRLSGPVVAAIYSGEINYWDDARIKKLNEHYKLPHKKIIPIHRTDGSGDTFIFSQYLSFSTPSWNKSVGYGTTISWPAVQGGIGAIGNPGMVQASQTNPYSIAYIGVSYHAEIAKAGLGTAELENRAGRFVLPNPRTVKAAAAEMLKKTPTDERVSLIFAPGAESYPIINYEYTIISRNQSNAETAAALKKFLLWAISDKGGNAAHYLDQVQFIALPSSVAELSRKQIEQIK